MSASPPVPDDMWEAIEPLLPPEPPKPKGGRPRVPDRAALGGIIFVLKTGCPWRLLPKTLGCGSGTTCWRRLRDWKEAGVWQRLHETLLNWLGNGAVIAWSRASVDSLSVRANGGRTDRAEPRRPRQARLQVPPGGGSQRYPAGGSALGGQRPRRHPTAPARRRDSLDLRPTRATGPSSEASGQAPRWQSLRLVGPAARPARSRHYPTHRPPRHRLLRATGAVSVGGRAYALLAARLSPPRCPRRAPCRPAPRIAPPRRCAGLSEMPCTRFGPRVPQPDPGRETPCLRSV